MHCGTKKRMKKGTGGKIGDYKGDIGNRTARREKMAYGGMKRMKYADGGMPKAKPC